MARRTKGSAYDAEADKVVETLYTEKTGPGRGVRVCVRQYKGGALKLSCEECWVDARSGNPRSQSMKRIPFALLAKVGADKIAAAIDAHGSEPAQASEPAADADPFAIAS